MPSEDGCVDVVSTSLTLVSCVQAGKMHPTLEGNCDSQRARSRLSFCNDEEPRNKVQSTAIGLACLGSLMRLAACASSASYGQGPAASGAFRSVPSSDGALEANCGDAGEHDAEALESLWRIRVAEVSERHTSRLYSRFEAIFHHCKPPMS